MPYKRLAAAAAALLAAAYLYYFLPVFAAEGVPALHDALDARQLVIYIPDSWQAWLDWD